MTYDLNTHLGVYLHRQNYQYPNGLVGTVTLDLNREPLEGFADASGDPTTRGETIFTINGCLSRPDMWQQFDVDLQGYLKDAGFKPVQDGRFVFHTNTFKSGNDKNAPNNLRRFDRDRICSDIARLITKHTLYRFGFGIKLSHWERFCLEFPTAIDDLGTHLSKLCFRENSDWANRHGFNHSISYVFDQGDDFWGVMYNDYRQRRKKLDPERWTVADLTEGDKIYSSPLQAADVVAWYARNDFRGLRDAHLFGLATPKRPHPDFWILNDTPETSGTFLVRYSDLKRDLVESVRSAVETYDNNSKTVSDDLIEKYQGIEGYTRAAFNFNKQWEEEERQTLRDEYFEKRKRRREENVKNEK